ncbi:hypothetical protein [Desulfogranum japonicum]|uniref:hypothetical protein n=1 Tax=Desulfogranum japonicum TaxID=231447 RepID=UPI0003FDEB85|nr:hypothetical protein [Desulfogranum japonicum]
MKYMLFSMCLCPVLLLMSLPASCVQAASCPVKTSYAGILYNHRLFNTYISSGTYSQASTLTGTVGIQVSPSGVANAGYNKLNRTTELVLTTSSCDCRSEKAESTVSVTVAGSCSQGVLTMNITEVYPNSSAVVTCTGGDSCPTYTQTFPGATVNHTLVMNYVDGTVVIKPYTCSNCSGNYSWTLNFTSGPQEDPVIPLRSIVPPLELLLLQKN